MGYVTFEALFEILGGSAAIIVGLLTITGKVILNRIREKDRAHYEGKIKETEAKLAAQINSLQARNAPIVHVHKMQFEKEFSEYQELWTKAVHVDTLFRRVTVLYDDANDYSNLVDDLYTAYNDLLIFNLNSHPFYFKNVYIAALDFLKSFEATTEIIDNHNDYLSARGTEDEDRFFDYDTSDFLEKFELRKDEIGSKILDLSVAIRDRWQSMTVVEREL